ncbi:hypothetical protein [Wolbachia endosymbiont (group B) of Gerris lacustris]|uniref:hypothetical protein n=1 Tax=Wolbachia endosymbiont (group B) of Gerris lacustris TaxID=3066159 RepID=UPI0033429353
MNYSKLEIICRYNSKFSYKGIEELLSDEDIVDSINNYDDELFRSILSDATSERNILEVLKDTCNSDYKLESSDDEENEEDYGYYDNFDCDEDEKTDTDDEKRKCILGDSQFDNYAGVEIPIANKDTIASIRLVQRIMVESGKLSDKHATELLKDQSLSDKVKSIGDKKLQLMLKSNKFSGEDIMKLLGNRERSKKCVKPKKK